MSYNSQIQLNVNLTPLNELKKQLDSTIKSLEKDSNIKLNINVNEINTSFKEMSNIISNLSNQLNKSFKLDTSGIDNVTNKLKNIQNLSSTSNTFKVKADGTTELVKSVDKINVGLGETITLTKDAQGQLTAMSNIDYSKKQKEIDEQYKLQLKDLKELNKLELKRQQELEKSQQKVKSIQETLNSKLNNSSKNNLIDESVLKNLQKELNSINVDTPISKIKELKNQINNLGSSDNQIVKIQNEINKMTNGLNSLKSKYGNLVGNSNSRKELEDYINEINKLKTTLNDLKSGKTFTGNQLSQQFSSAKNSSNELTNAVKNNASALKLAQKDASSFGDAIKHAFQNVGIYVGTYEAIRKTISVIKDASQYVIQLDSALVGLKKVTNETDATYKAFLETAHSASLELGTQADKFTEATESWAKTGKSLAEATQLAKNTMLLSKVGDVADVDTAQTYLLPALQAFNIEAEKSIDLVDKYNNISNNMATDVPKMGEAMARGASSLSVAGNTLEETLALIATASQNTQLSGETIGNGLKTISLRIAEFKDEDGEVIPKFEEQMKSLGVTMRDQNGQILSTYNILNQVAQKYGEMDKNSQLMTSSLLGGKFQANVVSSILSDVGELNRAYNLANNSAGSATKEFETYKQSIQYSIDQLKESVNHLYTEMVNSDALKSFVDGLSDAVQWLDSLDGETLVFIGTMGTAILLLTKLSKLNKTLMMSEAVSGLGKFIGLATGMIKLENGITGLSGAFGLLSGGIKSATASAMAFVATPLGAVITAIGVAIGIATVAFTSYKKHQEDLVKQSDDLKEAINGVNEAIANGDTSLASKQLDAVREQQKELQNLIKQRQELLKKDSNDFNQSTGGVDKQSAIDGVNKRIKEQIEVVKKAGLSVNEYTGEIDILVEKEQLIANENIVDKIEAETKAQIENKSELESATQEYQNHISTIQSLYSEYQNLSSQEDLSVQQKERLNGVIATLQGQFANLNIKIDENGRAYIENTPLIEDQISYLNSEGVTVNSLTGIRVNDSRVMSEWMVNGTNVTYTEIQKRILNYKEEIKAIQSLIQARMLEANVAISAKAPDMTQDSINDARAESKFLQQKQMYEKQIGSAENNLKELEGIKAQADAIYGGVSASGLSGGGGGSSVGSGSYTPSGGGSSKGGSGGSGKSDAEKAEEERIKNMEKLLELQTSLNIETDRYFEINNSLDTVNNELQAIADSKEYLTGDELIQVTQRENELKIEQIELSKEYAEAKKLEANELGTYLQEQGFMVDGNGLLINTTELLNQKTQELKDTQFDFSEQGIENFNNQKEALEDLKKKTEEYSTLVTSEIPKAVNEYKKLEYAMEQASYDNATKVRDMLYDTIKKERENARDDELKQIESDYDKTLDEIESDYEELKSELESQYEENKTAIEEEYANRKEVLEKEMQVKKDSLQSEIDKLQAELDAINAEEDTKQAQLDALKVEYDKWSKQTDDVVAERKMQEITETMKELERDIRKQQLQEQIDNLQNQQTNSEEFYDDEIDTLETTKEDELDTLETNYNNKLDKEEDYYNKSKEDAKAYYEEQKANAEEYWKTMLADRKLYEDANEELVTSSQEELIEKLSEFDESYKALGKKYGDSVRSEFIAQINQAYEYMQDKLADLDIDTDIEDDESTSSSSSKGSSGSKSSSSSVYTKSGDTYSSKESNMATAGGKKSSSSSSSSSSGLASAYKGSKPAGFATGGRTPSDIGEEGKLAILHSNEKILNDDDTKKLDDIYALMDNLPIFDEIKKMTSDISNTSLMPSYVPTSYNPISSLDVNKIIREITNNTNNNNSNKVENTITNNTTINNNNTQESYMNQRKLEKFWKQQLNPYTNK